MKAVSSLWNKSIRKIKSRKGMNLTELMLVIAILAILAAVAFIGVQRYQRSLGQLERDGIAKEIFVAAQNHVAAAKGQGYLEKGQYGTLGTTDEDKEKNIYYFVVNNGNVLGNGKDAFNLMLPFGAIDETLRLGGSYLVRYQPETATVLDVFYCSTNASRFNHTLSMDDYGTAMGLVDVGGTSKKPARRNVSGWNGGILGWYGGADAANLPSVTLKAPEVEIYNGEVLKVTVTNHNTTGKLRLLVTGEKSGTKHYLDYTKAFNDGTKQEFILDNLTDQALHFCNKAYDDAPTAANGFIPGEDITVQAVAYSVSELANIAYSTPKTTNSLFESVAIVTKTEGAATTKIETASIGNFRHLENLYQSISNLNAANTDKVNITAAKQTTDLDWAKDTDENGAVYWTGVTVRDKNGDPDDDNTGKFVPICPDYTLSYDGQKHSISNVVAEGDSAGLFGDSMTIETIENLELIDFDVTGTLVAGTLAGSLNGTTVSNVLARSKDKKATDVGVKSTSTGSVVGGLIGEINSGKVEYSAAAVRVGDANAATAGGLIGQALGDTQITYSYSGGHTQKGVYSAENYDVTAKNTAGGLVGDAANAAISYSYSTCSASAATAGGFAGRAQSAWVRNSYCTGLVSGTGDNAFLGNGSLSTAEGRESKDNFYYSIVNELEDRDENTNKLKGFKYKGPGDASVAAFDDTAANYEAFVGAETLWTPASPYDSLLLEHYSDKYPLQSVVRLGVTGADGKYVETHYGDWPAPEILLVNEAS